MGIAVSEKAHNGSGEEPIREITVEGGLAMANCEFRDDCRLMTELSKIAPELAKDYRENFCEGDCSKCARHIVATVLGPGKVPLDLFPTEASTVSEVIEVIKEWMDN